MRTLKLLAPKTWLYLSLDSGAFTGLIRSKWVRRRYQIAGHHRKPENPDLLTLGESAAYCRVSSRFPADNPRRYSTSHQHSGSGPAETGRTFSRTDFRIHRRMPKRVARISREVGSSLEECTEISTIDYAIERGSQLNRRPSCCYCFYPNPSLTVWVAFMPFATASVGHTSAVSAFLSDRAAA